MKSSLTLIALVFSTIALVAEDGSAHGNQPDTIRVVVTLPYLADVVRAVGGDSVEVTTLVRPHTRQINMMGGKGYSHAARLAIVPERAGTLVIPPISVSGISQARRGRSFATASRRPAPATRSASRP